MQTIRILIIALSSAAALLAGCGPRTPNSGQGIPDQTTFCYEDVGLEFPETRAVDLGFGPPSAFEPYEEGGEVESIVGPQGDTMITPVVRVEQGAGDGAEACLRVQVTETTDELASEWYVKFREEDGHLFSDGALYFLIDDARGDVTLDLTVQGKGFSGTKSLNVVLK